LCSCGRIARYYGDAGEGGSVEGGESGNNQPPDPGDSCSEAAKLVYVVDHDYTFSSFSPSTLTFHDIGKLNCPSPQGGTPWSMSIDRKGTAWVHYSTGELFNVDTGDGQCQATKFKVGQQGFQNFAMAFSANAPGSTEETLFIAGAPSWFASVPRSLGKVAIPSLVVTKIAGIMGTPDISGDGDGGLWAFHAWDQPVRMAQIDKTSGTEGKTYSLDSAFSANARVGDVAFARWGGDFWIFAQVNQVGEVLQLHSKTGTIAPVLPNTGRDIIGAGVSTCAPTVIQ
jgi:hypothetical protein